MNKVCSACFVALISYVLPAHGLADDFHKKLSQMGMTFTMPEGYVSISPKPNKDMNYDFAIRHPKANYEIRYALRPFEGGDQRWEFEFIVIACNISGKDPGNFASGSPEEPNYWSPDDVKAAFGGDSGLFVGIENLRSEFAGDYKSCVMTGIHRDNVGEAYTFHLFGASQEGRPAPDIDAALRATYPPFGGLVTLKFTDPQQAQKGVHDVSEH